MQSISQKPRLVVVSANPEDFLVEPEVAAFCREYGFSELGLYHDATLGEMPVRVFVSGDGKINARFFFLPGREAPVAEFESAFAHGECLVTTTAPITGEKAAWVDLLALEATVSFAAAAVKHGNRLAVAEARAGTEAVRIVDLASHFELRGRVEFGYDMSGVFPGARQSGVGMGDALWYYSLGGERRGPVRLAELKAMARAGQFNGSRDMAWMPEFPEWMRIREIPELAASMPAAQPDEPGIPIGTGAEERFDTEDPDEEPFREMMAARRDEGMGRLSYWFARYVLVPGLAFAGHFLMVRVIGSPGVALWSTVAIVVFGTLMVILSRLRNLGMSGGWLFGFLVPGVNIWVSYRLLVCPPGYAEHRRLGPAGVVMATLFWLSMLASIGVVVLWAIRGGQEVSGEQLREVIEKVRALVAPPRS
jgi:hypothetical protein